MFTDKNDLQNMIQESKNKYIIMQRERDTQYKLSKNQEIERLYDKVIAELKSGHIENGSVRIAIRLKYHVTGHYVNGKVFETFNEMFSTRQGIHISSMSITRKYRCDSSGSGEECSCCCLQSIFCIPLLYWIPAWHKDEKYGPLYKICVSFK